MLLSPWVGKVKMSFLSSSHSILGLPDAISVWRLCSLAPANTVRPRSNCELLLFQPLSHFIFLWHSLKKAMEEKSLFSIYAMSTMMTCIVIPTTHTLTYILPSAKLICLHNGRLFSSSELSWWLSDNLTWKLLLSFAASPLNIPSSSRMTRHSERLKINVETSLWVEELHSESGDSVRPFLSVITPIPTLSDWLGSHSYCRLIEKVGSYCKIWFCHVWWYLKPWFWKWESHMQFETANLRNIMHYSMCHWH